MSDVIPLPVAAICWLQQLARARDLGDGWDASEPYSTWEELLEIGMIEYRPVAWRLSDIGWWALGRVVMEGNDDS